MAEELVNLVKDINLQIQVAQQTPNRINLKKTELNIPPLPIILPSSSPSWTLKTPEFFDPGVREGAWLQVETPGDQSQLIDSNVRPRE